MDFTFQMDYIIIYMSPGGLIPRQIGWQRLYE